MRGYNGAEEGGSGLACREKSAVLAIQMRDREACELFRANLPVSFFRIKAQTELDEARNVAGRSGPH
jgi:hypothetical protein